MTKKTYTLVSRVCDLTGELSLFVKGSPTDGDMFGTLAGFVIAHDIVEHPDLESITSVKGELMALGAVWHCRGQYGDINRGNYHSVHDPCTQMAYALVDCARYWQSSENYCKLSPPSTRGVDRTMSFDEAFHSIWDEFERTYQHEEVSLSSEQIKEFRKAAFHYGRKGARKMQDRWGGDMKANSTFWNIADAVEKSACSRPEWEGQEWLLTIDDEGRTVVIEEFIIYGDW